MKRIKLSMTMVFVFLLLSRVGYGEESRLPILEQFKNKIKEHRDNCQQEFMPWKITTAEGNAARDILDDEALRILRQIFSSFERFRLAHDRLPSQRETNLAIYSWGYGDYVRGNEEGNREVHPTILEDDTMELRIGLRKPDRMERQWEEPVVKRGKWVLPAGMLCGVFGALVGGGFEGGGEHLGIGALLGAASCGSLAFLDTYEERDYSDHVVEEGYDYPVVYVRGPAPCGSVVE